MAQANEQGPTAAMVTIGNEILSGKITDTNSPFLCRELNFLGIRLERILTIPDDFALIGRVVREFSEAFTWVFTSGGIGPTHDDVTIPAIAAGFGVPAVRDPGLERTIREHYADRLTDDHLLMALIPEGAEMIPVEGLYYPQVRFHNVFILPGVPQLFEYKFNAIKGRFRGTPIVLHEIFMKADEGVIAATLREAAGRFSDVLIGSYPSFFRRDYSLKVTVEGHEADSVEAALAHLREGLGTLPVTIVRVT